MQSTTPCSSTATGPPSPRGEERPLLKGLGRTPLCTGPACRGQQTLPQPCPWAADKRTATAQRLGAASLCTRPMCRGQQALCSGWGTQGSPQPSSAHGWQSKGWAQLTASTEGLFRGLQALPSILRQSRAAAAQGGPPQAALSRRDLQAAASSGPMHRTAPQGSKTLRSCVAIVGWALQLLVQGLGAGPHSSDQCWSGTRACGGS